MAAMALLHTQGENLRSSQVLRDRSLALMVADNRIVEVMATQGQISTGRETGTEVLANRAWEWTRTVQPTQNPNVLRIDVTVTVDGDPTLLSQLSGFRGVR